MRAIIASPIVIVFSFLIIASFTASGGAAAQTDCVQALASGAAHGSWTGDCAGQNRPDAHARYFTFSLAERADVTITLESATDPYLFLSEGDGSNGFLAENDDIDRNGRDYNSRIEMLLAPGDYIIEATTYGKLATGDFTLTVTGVDFSAPPAIPTPTLTSSPTPGTSLELPGCVELVNASDEQAVIEGAWDEDCTSGIAAPNGSGDRYAQFYAFTLDAESDVTIMLTSNSDTFLYLREGIATEGEALHENDDYDYPRTTDSRIIASLAAGSYTIEVTTYNAGATGDFTLTVESDPVGDTTPPAPEPTPEPDPDNPIPAGCVLQNISGSGSTIEGAWTNDCVSQNRAENGEHYAKFYGFTVDRTSSLDITLDSRTDAYMFLLDEDGMVLDENDDHHGIFDLLSRSSGIRITLEPGNYIIEATTYASEDTGDFTLTIVSPDITALRALYHATDGANWTNNDNWLTNAPLSEWHGIKTNNEGSVTEIYLIGNNLVGSLPAELGGMHNLEGLYLARNELSGAIPPELGSLHNLETLMLFSNELSGAIPPQFGNLSSLEELHLGRNRLSGRIPITLGNLQNLTRLHLTVNELSGGIPASLGNLTELRQLSIAANNLSGPIPTEIADLSNLTHIYLWGNELLPGTFIIRLDELTELRFLDIGGSNIDGEDVLAELHALHNLTGLGVHNTGITDDQMAAYMDDLQALDLEFLNISGNNLSDLRTLVNLSEIESIQRLAIHGNDLSGELPRTMTRLTLMRLFYFHDNPGLCAPADDKFQDWLRDIRDVQGDTCTGGNPANAPAQQSSGDEFAAIMPHMGNAENNHSLLFDYLQAAGEG